MSDFVVHRPEAREFAEHCSAYVGQVPEEDCLRAVPIHGPARMVVSALLK